MKREVPMEVRLRWSEERRGWRSGGDEERLWEQWFDGDKENFTRRKRRSVGRWQRSMGKSGLAEWSFIADDTNDFFCYLFYLFRWLLCLFWNNFFVIAPKWKKVAPKTIFFIFNSRYFIYEGCKAGFLQLNRARLFYVATSLSKRL